MDEALSDEMGRELDAAEAARHDDDCDCMECWPPIPPKSVRHGKWVSDERYAELARPLDPLVAECARLRAENEDLQRERIAMYEVWQSESVQLAELERLRAVAEAAREWQTAADAYANDPRPAIGFLFVEAGRNLAAALTATAKEGETDG